MKKVALTFNEAAVLGAFDACSETSLPRLAVSARLTPSEIREAVNELQAKRLVELADHGQFVRLTPRGGEARLNWKPAVNLGGYSSPSTLRPNLDSALDSAIERLKGH